RSARRKNGWRIFASSRPKARRSKPSAGWASSRSAIPTTSCLRTCASRPSRNRPARSSFRQGFLSTLPRRRGARRLPTAAMIAKEEKLAAVSVAVKPAVRLPLLKQLGPGLIAGAADDDPSGIATYSQAGAQFGYGMLWSVLFTLPLMIGIQIVSARIGRVTGQGLAANVREHFPRPVLYAVVSLLLLANTLNLAADLRAMGDALVLLAGGKSAIYIVFFALLSLTLQIFIPFPRYAPLLKWLTLALFAYVGTVLVVRLPIESLRDTVIPQLLWRADYIAMLVAVLGTTISPYLFFWQASQEVEEQRATPGNEPLKDAPGQAREHLQRIKTDTYVGMMFSNLIALCIMLTTAATLHAAGVTDIQ